MKRNKPKSIFLESQLKIKVVLVALGSSLLVGNQDFFRFVALSGKVGGSAIIGMVVEHHLSVSFKNFVVVGL